MKTPTEHTPSPWMVFIDPADSKTKVGVDDGQAAVCTVNLVMTAHKANARLIAAAPDLLAALDDLLTWASIPDNGSKDAILLRDKARAAIAKAKGQA